MRKENRRYFAVISAMALVFLVFLAFGNTNLLEESKSDDLMVGHELFNLEDYERAAAVLEPIAKQGEGHAQYLMGLMEAFGLGRHMSRELAKDWIARSGARRTRGMAECYIGLDWATGHFGRVDLDEASHWIGYANQLYGSAFCEQELESKLPTR